MQLIWQADVSTSALHAAEAVARGQTLADAALADAIGPAAAALAAEIRVAGLPEARAWRNLTALAGQFPNNRLLAERTLVKTQGGTPSAQMIADLAGRIEDVEAAVNRLQPRLREDLALRERPIREQWEARGPGLLHQFARLTEPKLLVETATVILVHPALGGGGEAHLAQNAVRFEALLANPQPQLPEFVRLGWYLAQLNCDLPDNAEKIPADRLPQAVRLAMLPPLLAAANELEAAPEDALELALATWRIESPPGVELPTLLRQWWSVYQDGRPPFAVALTALDRMLG